MSIQPPARGRARMAGRLPVVLLLGTTAPCRPALAADAPTPVIEQSITVLGVSTLPAHDADTTALFTGTPGFSAYSAGGVSALPVLDGMADDRINTLIDGVRMESACPNHMNPAMSYIDPDMVQTARAIAGITPVSLGGDSTGGTIEIRRRPPRYAEPGHVLVTGRLAANYGSNADGRGVSGEVTVADDHLSLRWSGAYRQADNYRAGGDGGIVRSTSFLAFNHAATLGLQGRNDQFELTFGQQDIPYEAFANQYMDMTNNRSSFLNGRWTHRFDRGFLDGASLELGGHWQRVDHVMNMLDDKGGHSATTGMPMNTAARQAGYALDLTIPRGIHTVKLGTSFDHDGLNDWWPPLPGSMMMGPGTWHNVNDAHRDHEAQYLQWDAQWNRRLSTELGWRNDIVMMNTGPVAPYSRMAMSMGTMPMDAMPMDAMAMPSDDAMAADAFNAAHRGRTDVNFDVTATAKYLITDALDIEGGYARKTRSPNLYERYAWGVDAMAAEMIGWFGDGNGYVGNLNLKPETANIASFTLLWHDPAQGDADAQRWRLSVRPFINDTQNYINVVSLGALGAGASLLQFANHDAESFGVDVGGHARLWADRRFGRGTLDTTLSWVRGTDLTTGTSLYHQMPLNGVTTLSERLGAFAGRISLSWAAAKTLVDALRDEPATPGYALLGFGASWRWRGTTLDVGVDNALDHTYALPLGGRMLDAGEGRRALLASGRSVNVSLATTF